MACTDCQRRAALIAALAPAISRLPLGNQSLLGLLALGNTQLLRATKVKDPRRLLRDLELPRPADGIPTALCRHDPDYPETLAQLDCAPAVLYATCSTERLRELLTRPTVAIVGSRSYTGYARQITFELARELACAGVTVIAGVNPGLEGIAHRGVLHSNSGAITTMTCSSELAHLDSHQHLRQRILARGAAISEFPSGCSPALRWCFFASQRIIAALARLLVIIEAGGSSYGGFTAQIAIDLGTDIAVVPGRLTDPGGDLIFRLLREGAQPISCAQDVLELICPGHVGRIAA